MVTGGKSSEISRLSPMSWGISVFLHATYKWEKSIQKLNDTKVLLQRPVTDFHEPLGSWLTGKIAQLKSLDIVNPVREEKNKQKPQPS